MRLKCLFLFVLFAYSGWSFAAGPNQTHPFSIHDMLAMDRISDPQVSPDGRLIAFVVSQTDLEDNKRLTDLWLVDVDGTNLRRLTSNKAADSNPRWAPDGKSIWFVSGRSGSSQVWRIRTSESAGKLQRPSSPSRM